MELIYLSLLTFVAALVGTMTGFGTSTIMVPVLALFFPFPVVLMFVGILHWCGDVWKMALFRKVKWRTAFAFGIPAVIASFAGASLVLSIPQELLLRVLGAFLIVYVVSVLVFHAGFRGKPGLLASLVGGGTSGFFIGLFGFGGELRTIFLTLYRFPKAAYLATIGAIAFLTDLTRLATYWMNGVRIPEELLWHLAVLIPITLLGAWAAKRFLSRVPERRFRTMVLLVLLLVGVKLVIAP